MNKDQLELMGDLSVTPPWWVEAVKLCAAAHVLCENHDRGLPHVEGPDGCAVVVGEPYYTSSSRSFARSTYNALQQDLLVMGLSEREVCDVRTWIGARSINTLACIAGEELVSIRKNNDKANR